MWNVILNTLEGNQVIPSKNNPKKSGQYVCTCIFKMSDGEFRRYLRVMEYDAEKNYWHDIGHKSGISHRILAWKEEDICDFKDFKYIGGEIFEVE